MMVMVVMTGMMLSMMANVLMSLLMVVEQEEQKEGGEEKAQKQEHMDEEECDQGNGARGRRAEDETEKENKEMGNVNYTENNCDPVGHTVMNL